MRRRKKDSGLKTALLLIVAIIFMIMAISVIVIVFGKIHSDYEKLDMTRASEKQTLEISAAETKETGRECQSRLEDHQRIRCGISTFNADTDGCETGGPV